MCRNWLIKYSDGIIIGSEDVNEELKKYLITVNKPVLEFKDESEYIDAYNDFYDKILLIFPITLTELFLSLKISLDYYSRYSLQR